MQIRTTIASLLAVFVHSLCSPSSEAQIVAVESTYDPGKLYSGFPTDRTYGWKFDVGDTPLSVTHLGFFDEQLNGLNSSYQIGIWDTGGNLMVQGTVQSGTASSLVGAYRFELVNATTLNADTTYFIGAYNPQASDGAIMFEATPQTYAPQITWVEASYSSVGSFAQPDTRLAGGYGVHGANFQFTPVPEPLHYAVITGVGLVGFAFVRRTFRKGTI